MKKLFKEKFGIAASTHESEEYFCLKTHIKVKQKYNDIITIIFPRHINRVNQIKELSESLGLKSQILNKEENILENKEIIIVNTFKNCKNIFILQKVFL